MQNNNRKQNGQGRNNNNYKKKNQGPQHQQQQQQTQYQSPQYQQQQPQSKRNTQGREFRRIKEERKERERLRQFEQQKQEEFFNWFSSISLYNETIHSIIQQFQSVDNLEEAFFKLRINANQCESYITLLRMLGDARLDNYINMILRSQSFNTQITERCTLLLIYQNSIQYMNQELEIMYKLFSTLKLNDYMTLKQSSISSLYNLLKIIELYNPQLQKQAAKIMTDFDNFLKQIYNSAKVLEWREIPIYPVALEFFSYNKKPNQLFGKLEILPKENITFDRYIDYHFNLIREDYILELRDAIISVNESGFEFVDKEKTSNIGLYQNIELLSAGMSNSDLSWKIQVEQFTMDGRKQKQINWDKTKKLSSGSLICLTNIECFPLIFGVITRRDERQFQYKKNGKIQLEFKFLDPNASIMQLLNLFSQKTILMQYEGLVEPILYYLEALKQKVSIPFQSIIIENQKAVGFPQYLNKNCYFDIDLSYGKQYQGVKFNIFQQPWPQLNTSLDASQLNAVKLMLQKEVALIQGPPGTGKTYCGALAVRMLYQNLQKNDFPILIVCFTNHALDQFLEHILNFVPIDQVARLGGASKNPLLKECQIRCRQKVEFEFKDFNKLKKDISKIIQRMLNYDYKIKPQDIQKYWKELYDSIISNFLDDNELNEDYLFEDGKETLVKYWINQQKPEENKIVRGYLNGMHKYFRMDQYYEDAQQFENLQKTPGLIQQQHDDSDDDLDEYLDSEDEAVYNNNYKEMKFDSLGIDSAIQKFNENHQNQNLLHYQYQTIEKIKGYLNTQGSNPWFLSPVDIREIIIYCECLKYQNDSLKFGNLYKEFVEQSNKLKDLYDEKEIQILNSMKIVGATVTGVAKQTNKLQRLNSKIMVIEEAAEVLESHVASILTSNLQHLILIGDHQQLKPSIKNYFLQEKLKANVSLFERLFLNQIPSVTLTSQRRMKTKFADFIRIIYGDLYQDHYDIQKQNEIQIVGLEKDLVFFNHKWLEAQHENSKENKQEASMIFEMVQYLLKCGYKETQISVLTLYLKQAQVIKRKFYNANQPKVKVQTVDNYQGEENDIVIISLVRNNNKNNLGYIKIDNRINVALSRARLGLYVFGNFDFIFNSSAIGSAWQKIILLAKAKNCLNDYINTKCIPHGNLQIVKQPDDWIKIKPKLCNKKCLKTFANCNHLCNKDCHISDCHPAQSCSFQCDRIIDCGHKCKLFCRDKCKCNEIVDLNLPCNHKIRALCGTDPLSQKCHEKQEISFSKCNHKSEFLCYQREKYIYKCQSICQKKLPCGHICDKLCSVDCGFCVNKCQKPLPCGHENKCQNLCFQNCSPCEVSVLTNLKCGHTAEFSCSQQKQQILTHLCQQPCNKKRLCGHYDQVCKNKCNEQCSPCQKLVQRTLSCGHKIDVRCHDADYIVQNTNCVKQCEKPRKCGHDSACKSYCYQPCSPCLFMIKKKLGCGHTIDVECYKENQQHQCQEKCEKKRACKHDQKCKNLCFEVCSPCEEIISHTFKCGHTLKFQCHSSQESISNFSCNEPCILKRKCGHTDPCLAKCYQNQCSPCQEMVIKQLDCGHKIQIKCFEYNQKQQCLNPCNKIRECGHIYPCKKICYEKCDPCLQDVLKSLNCGHHHLIKCNVFDQPIVCKEECIKTRQCGHQYPCTNPCFQECTPCRQIIQLKLNCGHVIDIECSHSILAQSNYICKLQCIRRRACGHNFPCFNMCFKKDECTPCQFQTNKALDCGHQLQIPCFQQNQKIKALCDQPCNKARPCGHKVICLKKCYEPCTPCNEKCEINLPCGHLRFIDCYQKMDLNFLKELKCMFPCKKKPQCGHNQICSKKCYQQCDPCQTEVRLLLRCGHLQKAICSENPANIECTQNCKLMLPCGHPCKSQCGKPCSKCEEPFLKIFPACHHQRVVKCYEQTQQLVCIQQVPFIYACKKHTIQLPCFHATQLQPKCEKCKDCIIF
ncbi:unnamed protein product [Paramecium octaurelia]|uniref:NFX1-type zinc finger-containing protein 1 n=1 Tax=Paramecium octaurelia TaxID=43137 RepID=A0A8S1TWC9_PAROT|nr:unnamed protein product [Paramecium octaurelia]